MSYNPPTPPPPPAPSPFPSNDISQMDRQRKENELIAEKRKQAGIAFPSAGIQRQLLVVRLNIARALANDVGVVKAGLAKLCRVFADIASGTTRIDRINPGTGRMDRVPLTLFRFSATIGFGRGFFDLLKVPDDRRPARIREMPDHVGLGDVTPYSLGQTDLIIQLGSTDDFINRWVLENALEPETSGEQAPANPGQTSDDKAPDIVRAVEGWATITDIHAGFQRVDGRNLQGFNDGVSKPFLHHRSLVIFQHGNFDCHALND